MKFSEMKYERIDVKKLGQVYDELTSKVKSTKSANDVFSAIEQHEKQSSHFATMANIAYIRHRINNKPKFIVGACENNKFTPTSVLLANTKPSE